MLLSFFVVQTESSFSLVSFSLVLAPFFSMRGLAKADLRWTLVTTADNLKRMFSIGMRIATP